MVSRRRGVTRRWAGRRRADRSWFAAIVDATQGPSTFASTILIDVGDYQQGNMQPKAKMSTLYGHLSVGCSAAPGGDVNWAIFGILAIERDTVLTAPSLDPDSANNLTDERWLWTWRTIVPDSRQVISIPIHIKQKVKLADTRIVFVASNSDAAEAYDYTLDSRILITH